MTGEPDPAERDRLIDEATADRLTGGPDEAAAWAAAFGGKPDASPDAPLTDEERATLQELMVAARERGDDDTVDRLAAMEDDPAAFRQMMAELGPDAPTS